MFDLGQTVSESLKLAWKHKILWVFALLVAAGSGGGGGGNNLSNIADKYSGNGDEEVKTDIDYYEDLNLGNEYNTIPDDSTKIFDYLPQGVLGTIDSIGIPVDKPINSDIDPFAHFTEILPPYIGLLIPAFLIFLVFTIGLGLIINSWATGAFLNGIHKAITGQDYNLKELSGHGRVSLRELAKFRLLIMAIFFGVFIFLIAVPFIFFLIEQPLIGGLLAIPAFILFIVILVLISFGSIFAVRYISLRGYKYMDGLKAGIKAFRANVLNTVILAVTNCFVQTVASLAVLFALGGVALLMVGVYVGLFALDEVGTVLIVLLSILGVPVFIVVILGFMAFGGYLTTYKNFTWSKFFNTLQPPEPGIDMEVKN